MSNIPRDLEFVRADAGGLQLAAVEEGALGCLAQDYRVSHFFVVRSPAFPLDRLQAWAAEPPSAALDAGAASEAALDAGAASERWEARRAVLTARLRSAFSEPWLRSAIYFASPRLSDWIAGRDDASELAPKLSRTLTRYFMRAAGRETPFGLFAGVSLGQLSQRDNFELGPMSAYRKVSSVSASYLQQILAALAAPDVVRELLRHEPNPTLVSLNGSYRFSAIAAADLPEQPARCVTFKVPVTRQIERAIALARDGITLPDLARSIAGGRISHEAALEFARTLCRRSVLVPCFQPAATGLPLLATAVAQLSEYPALAREAALLASVGKQLALADREHEAGSYGDVAKPLGQLGPPPRSPPLQVELGKPAPNLTMSERVSGLFLEAASLIQRTSHPHAHELLRTFRERFSERYESRLVPLVEALDSELGIGLLRSVALPIGSLLADLPLPSSEPSTQTFDAFDLARLKLLNRALARGESICELDDQALQEFPAPRSPDGPESFAVIARLARVEGKLMVVAPALMGSTAFIARFCAAEPGLREALRKHVAAEQELAGDALLVDVAYLPPDESANLVARPVLRQFELPYLGKSGAPPERQIHIGDLSVGVSGQQVFLYSSAHRKRVKIRITHGLNNTHPNHPTLYRFFGALQEQDEAALSPGWSWGVLSDCEFLPRVVRGSTVLSLARFRLSAKELQPATEAEGAEAFALLQRLRARRGLPRWLTRSIGDQRLPIDLDNELSVDELLDEAKKRPYLVLEELLPAPGAAVLTGAEGAYAGEFVVPFLRKRPKAAVQPASAAQVQPPAVARRRAMGSDWLYAKVYAAASQMDAILASVHAGVIEPLANSAIKSWFYLPYADPDPHLRVRFKGAPSALRNKVLPALQRALEPASKSGLIWRLQFDVYERELERYGGPQGIELAERIFQADSDACRRLLEVCAHDGELRWQTALLGIDRLLGDFDFDLAERFTIARDASAGYGQELAADADTWKAIGAKFRVHAPRLTELIALTPERATGPEQRCLDILARRSSLVSPVCREFERARARGDVLVQASDLARSFAHLFAVRLLGLEARSHELLLFDFSKRIYESRIARARRGGPSLPPALGGVGRAGARG